MALFDSRILECERYSEPYAITTLIGIDGIAPRTEGRMLVYKDGSFSGTVGGGEMERKAIEASLESIHSGKSRRISIGVKKSGMAELYIDVPIKDRRVIIVGSGHVGKALADVFHFLSWSVTIVDTRESLATEERFPYARIALGSTIEEAFSSVDVDENSAIVIASPEEGMSLVPGLDKSKAFYIGAIGSRKRENPYPFLYSPIGLDIGGETPEEVALSISAEIVATFNKHSGGRLSSFRDNLVIVRGAGDLATGTIIRLHNAGYKVIALECRCPTVIRRTVSFASAVYDGEAIVEGVKAVLVDSISASLSQLDKGNVPILIDENGDAIANLRPCFVVDAILAKKNLGTRKDMAPFVVALGPGFEAGVDCDVVVETKRGHYLGSIINNGRAIENTGIPGIIEGYGKERVIHSPAEGVFKSRASIGDIVKKGDVVAYVSEVPVVATISGMLRGLLHDGLEVSEGFKIADIDPRGERADYLTISDKARAIAGGVLEALDSYKNRIQRTANA